MKKRLVIIGTCFLSILVFSLGISFLGRQKEMNGSPFDSDSGVAEIERIDLAPESLVF